MECTNCKTETGSSKYRMCIECWCKKKGVVYNGSRKCKVCNSETGSVYKPLCLSHYWNQHAQCPKCKKETLLMLDKNSLSKERKYFCKKCLNELQEKRGKNIAFKIHTWGTKKEHSFPWMYKNMRGVDRPINYLMPFYAFGAMMKTLAVLPVLIVFILPLTIFGWFMELFEKKEK